LADQLASASPDLLRGLLSIFIQALMGAEADALCGAEYRERSASRSNRRNGYRHRDFDTRAGTIDIAIPKLRQGSYFPDWLLARRMRAERALTSVAAPAICSVCPPGEWSDSSNPSVCQAFPSHKSLSWPPSSTSKWKRFAPGRSTPARTRSSPRTR
jgi:hypothetical protein